MAFDFDPGALLGRFYPLEGGLRACLRLARPTDAGAIRDLMMEGGESTTPGLWTPELRRLVSFDPRRQCVLCATALVENGERLLGVGSIELTDDAPDEPELLILHPEAPEGLRRLLSGALVGRAAVVAQARAA